MYGRRKGDIIMKRVQKVMMSFSNGLIMMVDADRADLIKKEAADNNVQVVVKSAPTLVLDIAAAFSGDK